MPETALQSLQFIAIIPVSLECQKKFQAFRGDGDREMKKLLLLLSVVLAATLFSAPLPCDKQALAISGCCKERNSLSRGWSKSGVPFIECKSRNRRDRDNVLDERGFVWWDVKCR